jgi:hypothetical protein
LINTKYIQTLAEIKVMKIRGPNSVVGLKIEANRGIDVTLATSFMG